MTTNKYIKLDDSAFFKIAGKDRGTFIQGLITNDINKCQENRAIYSAFLSPQGKFVADFFIIELEDSYLFETKKYFIENIINKLKLYKLKSEVEIIDIAEYDALALHAVRDIFPQLILPGQLNKISNGFVFTDPRNRKMGLKSIIKKNETENFCKSFSLVKDSYKNFDKKRIENIIPDSLLDLKINKSVLLENNFDSINAIDWDKGCYVGQEITARMKYRALIKKSLVKFIIIDGNIESNDKVFLNDLHIGYISSSSEKIGLAMLRLDQVKISKEKNIILDTNEGKIKVID